MKITGMKITGMKIKGMFNSASQHIVTPRGKLRGHTEESLYPLQDTIEAVANRPPQNNIVFPEEILITRRSLISGQWHRDDDKTTASEVFMMNENNAIAFQRALYNPNSTAVTPERQIVQGRDIAREILRITDIKFCRGSDILFWLASNGQYEDIYGIFNALSDRPADCVAILGDETERHRLEQAGFPANKILESVLSWQHDDRYTHSK